MGRSGAGKSTLVLHCLLGGLELLAEDSVLVGPHSLLATGIANFVHLRREALRFLDRRQRSAPVRHSTAIRRRSGGGKAPMDLPGTPRRRAGAAPRTRPGGFP